MSIHPVGEFDDFDFADFAQEFLRRNANYGSQYTRVTNGRLENLGSPECRKMAREWGLEFRVST